MHRHAEIEELLQEYGVPRLNAGDSSNQKAEN
jgi:hypothetical protein